MKVFKFILTAMVWMAWSVIFVLIVLTYNEYLPKIELLFAILGRIVLVVGLGIYGYYLTIDIQEIGNSKTSKLE